LNRKFQQVEVIPESFIDPLEVLRQEALDNIDQFSIHYYRLVQYDIDGKFEIFGPIVLDNRVKEKTIVKYVNLLGQEVGPEYKGVIFEIYEDGSSKRILR
jgi:hypothetical protein